MWQFVADSETNTLDITTLRLPDFHLNALHFLEPPPLLNLTIEKLKFNGNIIEVDIGLRHPFLGAVKFTGFDVCGIVITNGSVTGFTDTALRMAGKGDMRLLNPDGYSRWWNPAEFPHTTTMLGYRDGLLGTPDSSGHYNSTLNAYKYFCDDFVNPDDPMTVVTQGKRGIFAAGQKNIRYYTIELGSAGLVFNYAVDACWKFPLGDPPYTAPDDFPPKANRTEPWNIRVHESKNTLWNDGTGNGGDLKLRLDVYDWFNAGMNAIRVESPGNFPMVESAAPVGGGAGYSTYEVEILDATPAQDEINLLICAISEESDFEGFLPGINTTAYFTYTADVSGGLPGDKFKNIPLREGFIPWDLAVDPVNGELLIIYNDFQVWKYLPSDDYQVPAPSQPFCALDPQLPDGDPYPLNISKGFIDISPNHYTIVGFQRQVNDFVRRAWFHHIDPSGAEVAVGYEIYPAWGVVAGGGTGTFANNHFGIWGYYWGWPSGGYDTWADRTQETDYSAIIKYKKNIPYNSVNDKDQNPGHMIRGFEFDKDGENFWVLKSYLGQPAYWGSRFSMSEASGIFFSGAFFGTGIQGDNDDTFNEPRDITRDAQNRYMILDKLSNGTPRIKGWDVSGSSGSIPGQSIGGVDLTVIIGPPLKFDCDDYIHPTYGNMVFVIHGDDTVGYFLSIYFPGELPW
jgi:hypothetical protein